MISNEDANYRSIFKAISLFGGVQLFVILLGVIRTKVVALSIGPAGVGIIGLFTTALTLVFSIINLGIGSSSVKQISESISSNEALLFEKNLFVLNRLTIITGVLGGVFICILSPYLSLWSFGNKEYTFPFLILSLVLLFESFNTKNLVILQGLRKLKILGKASIYGNLIGSIISIPLFFFFKYGAIVPSLLILYLSNLLVSHIYTKNLNLQTCNFKYNEIKPIVKIFISLGIAMTLSSILVYAVSYIVRLYLSSEGGVKIVGLYQAGWAIVNGYVGLIFTAMAKDYYPRLASVNSNNFQVSKMANQQIELGLLIISPIIMGFLIFVNYIIVLLYSVEFLIIKNMMLWSLLGMFFKLLSWSISYIFLAKGLSRYFIVYELVGNIFTLVSSILGYKYWGLEGLGFSFLATNIFYLIVVFYFSNKVFQFKFSKESVKLLFLNFAICFLSVFIIRMNICVNIFIHYGVLMLNFFIIFFLSAFVLERKLGVLKYLKLKFK